MPAWLIPALMTGAAAGAGAMGNKKKTVSSVPVVAPEYKGMQGALLNLIQQRLASPTSLPSGYEAGQIRDINSAYGLAGQNLSNRMTARGLGTSPVAGAGETKLALGRAGEISRMRAALPLVERTLRDQDLSLATNVLRTGMGTSATDPGNMTGGAFTSAADMLAYLYGKGAFGGASTSAAAPITIGAGASAAPAVGGMAVAPAAFTGWAPTSSVASSSVASASPTASLLSKFKVLFGAGEASTPSSTGLTLQQIEFIKMLQKAQDEKIETPYDDIFGGE